MKRKVRSFPCFIISVHDGDTLTCNVDLGFKVWKHQIIRLYGVDAPELKDGEIAEKAKAFVSSFIGKELLLISYKPDKFGDRYLGVIKEEGSEKSINELLMDLKLATPYDGGKR